MENSIHTLFENLYSKTEFGKRQRQLQKNNLEEKENYSYSTEKENCFTEKLIDRKRIFFCRKKVFLAEHIYQQKNR